MYKQVRKRKLSVTVFPSVSTRYQTECNLKSTLESCALANSDNNAWQSCAMIMSSACTLDSLLILALSLALSRLSGILQGRRYAECRMDNHIWLQMSLQGMLCRSAAVQTKKVSAMVDACDAWTHLRPIAKMPGLLAGPCVPCISQTKGS